MNLQMNEGERKQAQEFTDQLQEWKEFKDTLRGEGSRADSAEGELCSIRS